MLSRLLKTFLLAILMVCIGWAVCIFAGPSIISALLNKSYGGSIQASKIKVSPKLEIYAPVVKLDGLKINSKREISGEIRAVSLALDGIFGGRPHLKVRVGPSEVYSYGKVGRISGLVEADSLIYSKNYEFNFDIHNLDLLDEAVVDNISLSAELDRRAATLKNFELSGNRLSLFGELKINAEKSWQLK